MQLLAKCLIWAEDLSFLVGLSLGFEKLGNGYVGFGLPDNLELQSWKDALFMFEFDDQSFDVVLLGFVFGLSRGEDEGDTETTLMDVAEANGAGTPAHPVD